PNRNAIASSVSRDVTGHRYITDEPRGSRAGGCSSAWRAAASTGARARQTETPCPRARAGPGLRGWLRPARLESRPMGATPLGGADRRVLAVAAHGAGAPVSSL